MTLRFGLIGCGEIGRLRAQALDRTGAGSLVAVNDLDDSRAKHLAIAHASQPERHWQDLIRREDLDAVVVSTPPSLHAEMCIAAMEAGKHVLCEKPLTRTSQEGLHVLEAVERTGRFLATGFNYRFYPSIIKARDILASGRIGELDHIRSYAGYTAADHHQEWLHDAAVMGGGALRDNGIHLIDLTLYFLGGADQVKGFASDGVWNFEGCEDNGFLLLRSPAGKIATLQASWTEWRGYKFVIELYGTRGAIRASCFPMVTQVTWSESLGGKPQHQTHYFPYVQVMEKLRSYRWVVIQSFIQEFEAFARVIKGEPSEVATGLDGLRSIEVAALATHTGTP